MPHHPRRREREKRLVSWLLQTILSCGCGVETTVVLVIAQCIFRKVPDRPFHHFRASKSVDGVSELSKIRRSANFEALLLWNSRLGSLPVGTYYVDGKRRPEGEKRRQKRCKRWNYFVREEVSNQHVRCYHCCHCFMLGVYLWSDLSQWITNERLPCFYKVGYLLTCSCEHMQKVRGLLGEKRLNRFTTAISCIVLRL